MDEVVQEWGPGGILKQADGRKCVLPRARLRLSAHSFVHLRERKAPPG